MTTIANLIIIDNIIIMTLTRIGIQFSQKTILARMPGVVSIGGLEIRMKGEKKRAMQRMQFAEGIHKKTNRNTQIQIQKYRNSIHKFKYRLD